jgi:hypothetical protein
MSKPPVTQPETSTPHDSAGAVTPRTDFIGAILWMALGSAILIGSITMDRLEKQDVNPYTIPGLLPGLLGIAMVLLGALLGLRSWQDGALTPAAEGNHQHGFAINKHLLLVLGLCLTFDVLLVGHGLPFWLAGALFVTVSILSLQHAQRKAAGQKLTLKTVVTALAIGVGAAGGITLVFQEIFLVHLP